MNIKVKKSIIYWHDADLYVPKDAGEYLVITKNGALLNDVQYTPEGGFNTFYDDGEVKGTVLNVSLWSTPVTIDEVII